MIWSTKKPHGIWKEFSLFSSQIAFLSILSAGLFMHKDFWLGLEGKTGRTHSFHPVIPNIQVLQQLEKAVLATKRLWSAAARNIPQSMQNDIRVSKWPWLPTKGRTAMQHKTVQVPLVDRIRWGKMHCTYLGQNQQCISFSVSIGWQSLHFLYFTDSSPLKDQWIYIV